VGIESQEISAIADVLDQAIVSCRSVPLVTAQWPDLDAEAAYRVQDELKRRAIARGENLTGHKIGLTSRAKMNQMGVSEPIFGYLTDRAAYSDGSNLQHDRFIHPRIEPEMAIVTGKPLEGPGCTLASVLAAIDFIVPAVEIIDSRYSDFRFDLAGVIADNTSAAGYVVGSTMSRSALSDLPQRGVVVEKNGVIVELGAVAAVMGHPAMAVASLVNHLALQTQMLPAGSFVLAGGITAAIPAGKGDYFSVQFQGLGTMRFRFE
jgi:2-oxo-3-hexenedioate decarboxylase